MTSGNSQANHRPITVSHVFGEIVWLLGQSEKHADITAGDMNWLIMPPILHRQFHIFREGERPIGVALWAKLDESGERKVMRGLRTTNTRLEDAEWTAGDRLWLVEFVAPFASPENRHAEFMMGDLITGPLSGLPVKLLSTDKNGVGRVVSMPADAGERLVAELRVIADAIQ